MAEYTISRKSAIEKLRKANITVFESDSNERLKHELEKETIFIHYTVVDPDQKNNLSIGRDDIEFIIVEIMTHHGPDGHTDGCDVITDFIVDLQKGNQQVWIDKYLPKKNP
jgi:hypothetical protein